MLLDYVEQAPKVLARESLRLIEAYALGSGSLKRGHTESKLRTLERRASGRSGQRAASAGTREQAAATFGAMGIGVEFVSATGDAEPGADNGG